jgi:hypothetical protein
MLQGNFRQRPGTGCDTGNGNGNGNGGATRTIDPEVLPPETTGQVSRMIPGQNGTVDARLFYLLLGGVSVFVFLSWCDNRRGAK